MLLPLYSASYGYQGKTYSYAINGQTGRVTGSYPKSALKITLAVIAAIIVFFGLYWLFESYSGGSSGGYYYGGSSYFDNSQDYEYADDYDSWFSPSHNSGGSQWYYSGYDGSGYAGDGYYDYDSDPAGYLDEYRDGAAPTTEDDEAAEKTDDAAQDAGAA